MDFVKVSLTITPAVTVSHLILECEVSGVDNEFFRDTAAIHTGATDGLLFGNGDTGTVGSCPLGGSYPPEPAPITKRS